MWLWLAGFVAGAAAVFFFARRPEGSLPVPGKKLSSQPPEEITDTERSKLREILEEQGRH
jgi:hypothetical protein